MEKIQRPRGTKDILPSEFRYWNHLTNLLEHIAACQSFKRIETPLIEQTALFNRTVGETSDIVLKEMFFVSHKEGESEEKEGSLALRPEGTAGVVRAYLEEGLSQEPQPLRLYSLGPMFRHNRPQKGRYREFHQFGIETIGEGDASADALTVLVGWQIFNALKLKKEFIVVINSIGCNICRPRYLQKLKNYLKEYLELFDEETKNRVSLNPLGFLDSKEEKYHSIVEAAPQSLDYLCDECKAHFQILLEYLDELSILYDLSPHLVRGLDYYNRTVFEIRSKDDKTGKNALLGGGRYDGLIETLGGPATPAVGFALGMERVIEEIKESKIPIKKPPLGEVFIIQLGERAKKRAIALISQIAQNGISVNSALSKDSFRSQLRTADKSGARLSIILGARELLDHSVILKDMKSGGQETIESDKLIEELKARLKIKEE